MEQLRAEILALESEVAESMRALAEVQMKATAAEHRAMAAIRAGDDVAARASLHEQGVHAEKMAALEDDLRVLRAILDECHEFMAKVAPP